MRPLISLAASAERCASARTSERDDGEAAPGVAGARRFDAGVQREQIGLERDLVDHADDLADLLRRFGDRVHRLDRLAHHDGAFLGVVVGGGDHLARVRRALGGFPAPSR